MPRKTWAIFDNSDPPRATMLVTSNDREQAVINMRRGEDGEPLPGWEVLRMPDGTRMLNGLTKEQAVAEDS